MEEFLREKIVWKIIGSNINFLIDEEGYFYNNAANILTSKSISLKSLIAFLNSKILEWYFKRIIFIEVEGGGIQMFNTVMERVPLPILPHNISSNMEKTVTEIIKNPSGESIAIYSQSINEIIYRVYDLTNDEINYIENWKQA